MSSCITGGGRAYRLDLDIIKSPSNSWISNSSSPSSTLSESSNFSTRKPRTPRKRPNQTYNEAAAILSTAHPKLFPTKHLINKFTKPYDHTTKNPLLFDPHAELLMPYQIIDTSEYLLLPPIVKPQNSPVQLKQLSSLEKQCQSPGETEITSQGNYVEIPPDDDDYRDDFDAESILDEEIGDGIDSIMGNLDVESENATESTTIDDSATFFTNSQINTSCYGYPADLGFEFGNKLRSEIRAIRNVDEGDDWWRFPSVNVAADANNHKSAKIQGEKSKKKKKKVEIRVLESANKEDKLPSEELVPQPIAKLMLKLNYDDVLTAWSDKDSPFSGEAPGAEGGENDVQARLAQIDLFSENGGVREASVLRYKEKRRNRLFSKKIRYQVRKVNADRRPRMKGRFVRTPNSPDNEQG